MFPWLVGIAVEAIPQMGKVSKKQAPPEWLPGHLTKVDQTHNRFLVQFDDNREPAHCWYVCEHRHSMNTLCTDRTSIIKQVDELKLFYFTVLNKEYDFIQVPVYFQRSSLQGMLLNISLVFAHYQLEC